MKSILQKLKGVLSKNVSIADYRKYLSDKYGKFDEEDYLEERARPASKTKFQKAMAKVVKVLPPDYDRLLPSIVQSFAPKRIINRTGVNRSPVYDSITHHSNVHV